MTQASRRKWLAPEVIQTSAMDCGPASLKCLLEGFGVAASYGRLREACQTDVDGTSIDTIEEIAGELGLAAEQIMVPPSHLLLASADVLPAVVVVRLPNGFTHFVVVWRIHGPIVQIMDPASGRCWMTATRFLERLHIHTQPVPVATYRDWTTSDDFLEPFRQRLGRIGCAKELAGITRDAVSDPNWQTIAALDAATSMVESLVRAGGIARGKQAAKAVRFHFDEWMRRREEGIIPEAYWSARAAEKKAEGGDEQVLLRGAVAVRVEGRRPRTDELSARRPLSPELVASLAEPRAAAGRELLRILQKDGVLTPGALVFAIALAACGTTLEAALLRGLFDFGHVLGLRQQRIAAMAALVVFLAAMLALEFPILRGVQRIGRHLEIRLRLAFLEKLPRLGDRYFQSRPISDMAERSHSVHRLRTLPELGGDLLRSAMELAVTTAAIAWLDPRVALVALLASLFAFAIPLATHPLLLERDLRLRSHGGAIARFYLDALLGLVPVRTHGAEQAVASEHEGLLVEWVHAARSVVRSVVAAEALQGLVGVALVTWIVFQHVARARDPGSTLLLVYWVLGLPVIAQQFAATLRQYPALRNVTLRLLEPLGALDEPSIPAVEPTESDASRRGATVAFENVDVVTGGHTILQGLDARIEAGCHVAIVGPSGAGKSSLVGLLLGWHRPASGRVLLDEKPLDGIGLAELRRTSAWVDPSVQLWNRSLVENLHYGCEDGTSRLAPIVDAAELRALLERLPDGLQTRLGEGGALVSGGEGQRVRLGRAMLRRQVRLVILDEPFRGLDRETRRRLMARAREFWKHATLLCITHDMRETLAFERAMVIEGGRIVEDDSPTALARRAGSRYRKMLDAEDSVGALWKTDGWRRLRLERGKLVERAGAGSGDPVSVIVAVDAAAKERT